MLSDWLPRNHDADLPAGPVECIGQFVVFMLSEAQTPESTDAVMSASKPTDVKTRQETRRRNYVETTSEKVH